MKTIATLAVAIIATGCTNPFASDPDPTLTITVETREGTSVQWPPDDTTWVEIANGLDDPNGFAGLEVIISGDAIPKRIYSAQSFANGAQPKSTMPATGYVTMVIRIVQDKRTVAEISERWKLEPRLQWHIEVARGPYPVDSFFPNDIENPECRGFWCAFIWRAPITQDAANYSDEALWAIVDRYDPRECYDVCPWWK